MTICMIHSKYGFIKQWKFFPVTLHSCTHENGKQDLQILSIQWARSICIKIMELLHLKELRRKKKNKNKTNKGYGYCVQKYHDFVEF